MFAFKKRVLWIILLCTVMTALLVGGVSIFMSILHTREGADRELQLQCEKTAADVSAVFSNIRLAVDFGNRLMLDGFRRSPDVLNNAAALQAFTDVLEDRVVSQARFMPGCVAVYVRYAPEFPVEGFFYTREDGDELLSHPMTPLEKYDPSDMEHVGWYYEPLRAGSAIWTAPYENKNLDLHMISYVVPIYYKERTVGVIGMDVDLNYLKLSLTDFQSDDAGYTFVTYDDRIVIHEDIPFNTSMKEEPELAALAAGLEKARREQASVGDYEYHGVDKRYAQKNLESGMTLFWCAPESEIYKDTDKLKYRLIAVMVCATGFVMFIMNAVLNRFIRIATTDALTRLPNRERFGAFFAHAQNSRKDYVFFLLDIDKFKHINDTFGHEKGDKVLRRVAAALRKISKRGMIARWGGDEFIGMLPTAVAEGRLRTFCDMIKTVNDPVYGRISVSIGACHVDKRASLEELIRAADKGMYLSKEKYGCQVTWEELQLRTKK